MHASVDFCDQFRPEFFNGIFLLREAKPKNAIVNPPPPKKKLETIVSPACAHPR
jgi:hypothetical protein